MQPEIDIGPLTLQTFGLMFALGVPRRRARWSGGGCEELGKPWTGPTRWSSRRWSAGWSAPGGSIDPELDEVSDDLLGNIFSGLRAGLVRGR